MKTTRRRLIKFITEQVLDQLKLGLHQKAVGPHRGTSFLDLVVGKLVAGEYSAAANFVLDSYMYDEIQPEEMKSLVSVLKSVGKGKSTRPDDVVAAVESWVIEKSSGKFSNLHEVEDDVWDNATGDIAVSYTHLTLPTNREV